jgi:cellulose synthase/poly-beta-1,6-N-acetylglucosamine synthase-like glycosyltransferase
MDALVVFMIFLFGFPSAIFCFYAMVLVYYVKITPRKKCKYQVTPADSTTYEPTVSVVIPTHNEQDVIARRIDNLLASNYPKSKLGIILVDDSTDSTPKIIEEYAKKYAQIGLVRFNERMGYSPCLIAGCKAARGEIVVLAEASSLMDADAIRYLVSNFVDPSIGVVTGKDIILNANEKAGQSEGFYLKLLDFVRRAESNMDSTIYMKGEAAAVRRGILGDLKELETCPGTADTGIALLARKKGFRAIYDPRVQFFEYAPSTHRERIRQKVTRGANLMKVLWEFRNMFLNPTYGKFGTITLPISFMMLAIFPLMLLAGVTVLALLTVATPVIYLPIWALGIFLLVLALLFWRPAVCAILESEYSLLKGLYDILILGKSHDKIDKVMSTRRLRS